MKITNNLDKDLVLVFGDVNQEEPTGSLNLKKQSSVEFDLSPFSIIQIEK